MPQLRVEYTSNNSGGDWWLTDEHWIALEAAGWIVEWYKDSEFHQKYNGGERFLGALASHAVREGLSLGAAITEWEFITGERSNELGCSCCGAPHSFTLYNGDQWVESYSASQPAEGERYSG